MTTENTIAEIFSRDPRPPHTTDEDIDKMIAYYRERRHQFQAGNMRAGKTAKPDPKLGGIELNLDGIKL